MENTLPPNPEGSQPTSSTPEPVAAPVMETQEPESPQVAEAPQTAPVSAAKPEIPPSTPGANSASSTSKPAAKMSALMMLVFALLLAVVTGIFAYYMGRQQSQDNMATPEVSPSPMPDDGTGVACTMDAKICPDGSAVGRTGPNCEFAECPGQTSTGSAEVSSNETYEDVANAYSFELPMGWVLGETGEGCGPVFRPPNQENVWITICGLYVNPNESASQLAVQSAGSQELVYRKNLTVDQHQAVQQQLKNGNQSQIETYIDKVESGDAMGTLGVYLYLNDPQANQAEMIKALDQILASFNFAN